MKSFVVKFALTGALLVATQQTASSAGFFVPQQGAAGLGRAQAGASAIADDPSTLFYNPAGMTRLEASQWMIGVNIISPTLEFEDLGSTATTPGTLGTTVPMTGKVDDDPGLTTPVPNAYFVFPSLTERLSVGVSLTAPFGLREEHESGWIGRYDFVEAELITLDLAVAVAYELNSSVSLGAGLDVQRAEVELTNAVPNPVAPGGPTSATDGTAVIQGDDVTVGYNIGILITPAGQTRVGLHYRSEMSHSLEGTAQISGLSGPLSFANGTVGARADIDLPPVFSFGVAHTLATSSLTLLGR